MADDRLREYYDAQQPSEALVEKLRAMEAPPKKPRRRVLPIAAAAVLALVLAAAFWPTAEPQTVPEPELEAGDAAAEETPAPTTAPTIAPGIQPTAKPASPKATPPPVSLAAPTPTPPAVTEPTPTEEIPNGTGVPIPPESGTLPGSPGDLPELGEYLLQNGRHLVRIWLSEEEEITLDLTDLLVDGHFEGEVDAGDMYINIFLTVYDDGTADLAIGGARMKGVER